MTNARRWAGLVLLAAAIVGCSRPQEGGSATLLSPSIPPATPSLVLPAASPSLPTPRPTPSLTEVESPSGPPRPEPPAASLSVEGGDPVVGQLGGYAWDNTGSAAPWLPGSPIHVGAGETLILALAEKVEVDRWTVQRTPFETFGDGEVGMAEGEGDSIRFLAPPRGTWSVYVGVWFARNRGDASYYWAIEVD